MATTIKTPAPADLRKMLAEKRDALQTFRFGLSGSKVKNVKEGREIRKEIARILTQLNTKTAAK